MERTGKELDLDNNNIINLKNPQNDQDAATKIYTDRKIERYAWQVHTLTPLSTRGEYIRAINSKHITMINLASIVTIETDLKLVCKYSDAKIHDPYYWLEASCASNRVWLPSQDMKDKHITVTYRYMVSVNNWKLKLGFDKYTRFDIKFSWQGSNDGKEWYKLTDPVDTEPVEKYWIGNTHEIEFKNANCDHQFFHWRLIFHHGTVPKQNINDPWVNLMLMNLKVHE